MEELHDSSPMPFGKFKGKEMQDVPAAYLMFLWDENKDIYHAKGKLNANTYLVMGYIEDNLDALKLELKKR